MLEALIVFIAQLLLVFFKHLGIRAISNGRVLLTSMYTVAIQSLWLLSSALGINALLNHEWLIVLAYISGGVIGSLLQFRITIKDKHENQND